MSEAIDSADASFQLGDTFLLQGKPGDAVACFQRVIELMPERAEAHCKLGDALSDLGQWQEAIAYYHRAIELQPTFVPAHYNLGTALKDQGKLEEAAVSFRKALELKPDFVEAHVNLGFTFQMRGDLGEAIACYRRAVACAPDFAQAHYNLGIACRDAGLHQEALTHLRRASELRPENAQFHLDAALLMLRMGDFEHGWSEYEYRWRTGEFPALQFTQPQWEGEELAGKTILLRAEQGFGDTIQFIRYASVIKRLGPTVIVQCQRRLMQLVASAQGIDQLISVEDQPPGFDYYSPLLSVPRVLKTGEQTFPKEVPYLFADPGLVLYWREKLRDFTGFRIGIQWRGRPGQGMWTKRDISLDCFAAVANIPGTHLIGLQKATTPDERAKALESLDVTDPGESIDEAHGGFMDTAAVMKNLDLVITSDTAVAHLAGALGVPVWVALPYVPDWRWLLDRSDSPWYPTMRLFRQKKFGDWAGAFEEIEGALRQMVTR